MRGARLAAIVVGLLLLWLVGYPLLHAVREGLAGPGLLGALGEWARRGDEWRALWRSLWISLASVAVAGALGVPLAFFFTRAEFPGRRLLARLLALPVALPPLVGVLAFLFLYGESGFLTRAVQGSLRLESAPWRLQGWAAILFVHGYSMYVYFFLLVRAGLGRLDPSLEEAAAALGASKTRTLWRVVLPQLRSALLAAGLLTFMTALGSFSAPYLFGGTFRVMTTQILAAKLNGDSAAAAAETVALLAVAIAGLGVARAIEPAAPSRATGRGVALRRASAAPGRRVLSAFCGWALAIALLLPHLALLLVSLVPVGTWTVEALPPVLSFDNYLRLASEAERLRPILNSLWMATAATAGALLLGLGAALAARRAGGWLAGALRGLLALPWAIPGTVFAVALASTMSVSAPWQLRFILVGTPLILPLAYLVRSLPLVGRAAVAGLDQLGPEVEEAAAALGAGPWRRLRKVVLPLVKPALVAGCGIAFITALGDFVVSIVLYTFDTRPISVEILSNLRLQELGVASAYGVVLTAASAAAFLLWGERETAS
jgi:iron(III) transport system permease protein